jgi:capsular exopolysaccharide synthesis family protein
VEGFFGLDHEPGVTNVLAGDIEASAAIRFTDIPNLRIVSSGPVPPNPSELLASAEFEMLLVTLRKTADFVIVDAPPVLAVTDALEMATKADGVMLVSDPAVSTREMVDQARQQLEQVGANLVGGVMNNLAATRFSYYPYYPTSYRQGAPYEANSRSGWSGFLSRLRPSKGKT